MSLLVSTTQVVIAEISDSLMSALLPVATSLLVSFCILPDLLLLTFVFLVSLHYLLFLAAPAITQFLVLDLYRTICRFLLSSAP